VGVLRGDDPAAVRDRRRQDASWIAPDRSARCWSGWRCSPLGVVVAALAPTMLVLLLGRFIQGLGGGAVNLCLHGGDGAGPTTPASAPAS
jgi:MFS family permease